MKKGSQAQNGAVTDPDRIVPCNTRFLRRRSWPQQKTRSSSRPRKGDVTIEMKPDLAPNHVARIKELVREGFYDGVVFHRVIDGFMAQTGCPKAPAPAAPARS
jgi:hypothetical protein